MPRIKNLIYLPTHSPHKYSGIVIKQFFYFFIRTAEVRITNKNILNQRNKIAK